MNQKSSSTSWGGICFVSFLLAGALVFLGLVWHVSDRQRDYEIDDPAVSRVEDDQPEAPATPVADEPAEPDDAGQADGWILPADQRPPEHASGPPGQDGTAGWADVIEQPDGQDDPQQADLLVDVVPPDQPDFVEPTEPGAAYSPVDRGTVEPVFGLPGHVTEHYVIYSQLSEQATYDIARRMEAVYDYYAERFSEVYYPIDFTKSVFLFNNRADFVAAGGHATMPGQFMSGGDGHGARLMMIFHEGNIGAFMSSCPLMYHEGFHQFEQIEISQAGNVNRQWPLWLDEGYATMFNNITWTGDGWVDGCIRLEYADSATNSTSSFIDLKDLLNISGANWHELTNAGGIWPIYMEGMSLIYFLNHADDGGHRSLLDDYVMQVSTGQDASRSTRQIIALQSRFGRWFSANMNLHITGAKYYEILTAMATSHLARAHARGQRFTSGEDFLVKAGAGQLKLPPIGDEQWLPDTLRQELLYYHDTLTQSHQAFEFEIEYPHGGGNPVVRVHQPRFGLALKGTFELADDGTVLSVDVEYVKCPSLDLAKAKKIVGTTD